MSTHTIFYVRAKYEGVYIDSQVSYDDPGEECLTRMRERVTAEEVAAKLEERMPEKLDGTFLREYPEIWRAMRQVDMMAMRARFNNDMRGPYHLITDGPLTDDDLVAWWKAEHGSKR